MPDRLLYDVQSAAEVLSIGRTKLYELIASGAIDTVTVGRRRLVPRASLDAFVSRL